MNEKQTGNNGMEGRQVIMENNKTKTGSKAYYRDFFLYFLYATGFGPVHDKYKHPLSRLSRSASNSLEGHDLKPARHTHFSFLLCFFAFLFCVCLYHYFAKK
jgi:hypothetical protein